MYCPVCKDVSLKMADRQGVEIDYCPECRGIWLDRGELDKIIDRTSQQHFDQPKSEPRESYTKDSYKRDSYSKDDPRYRKKKKRGGFLEDLFDFDF